MGYNEFDHQQCANYYLMNEDYNSKYQQKQDNNNVQYYYNQHNQQNNPLYQ